MSRTPENEGQEKRVRVDSDRATELFGYQDQNLKLIEKSFAVRLIPRGNEVVLQGEREEVDKVEKLLLRLNGALKDGHLSSAEIRYALRLTREGKEEVLDDLFSEVVVVTNRGRPLRPKTLGQKEYVDAIKKSGIVFGIGPAGTGKTYLAMAMAIAAFKNREVNRIVLTRPAVEAGEKLGFLPGDLQEKVNPYLRPLYDALFDILGVETFEKHLAKNLIEVAPLAYMRGRTLDDAFVILDEAQNTTPEQMKMFLTRLGFGSRAVITGDITQVDLPKGQFSGLEQARQVLKDIEGISFVYLTERDVVRHPLVQKVIKAYEAYEGKKGEEENPLFPIQEEVRTID
ncbi:MAG: PhoH family protein [Firmicutes bacterium]|nr:PhoH family protein [Bacillota bacterium]MCL5039411.1 PhoH family protein [Bacillota bacterium]